MAVTLDGNPNCHNGQHDNFFGEIGTLCGGFIYFVTLCNLKRATMPGISWPPYWRKTMDVPLPVDSDSAVLKLNQEDTNSQ
jgi:hypothetical protein